MMPIVAIALLVLIGGGWYFSSVIEEDGFRVDNADPTPNLKVVAITDDSITLEQLPDTEEAENLSVSAKWGVTDGANYGELGNLISDSGGLITRQYQASLGGFRVGHEVYLDRTTVPHDPSGRYLFEEVVIQSDIGEIDAWYFPVTGSASYPSESTDTWAIYVHGRTSNRDIFLNKMSLPGVNSLVIDYRNDEGAPPSDSGYYDFGTTEWRDVEASVQYALDHGAKKIVLVGNSMGGGIVVNYQLKSDLASYTTGMILDAPMLNFGRTVDKGAEERSVPPPITAAAKIFATLRFGVDWKALDYLSHADKLTVPVLLFHGEADDTVPVETSIEFAEAAPDIVELHTYKNVGHVEAWNYHPIEYREFLTEFIERVR